MKRETVLRKLGFNAARSMICGATNPTSIERTFAQRFQCRTQHDMWCNFLYRFSLMGRHFYRKTTVSIDAFPCAARSCAQMENGDGRMRLCGIAVAFSTFLHLLYHIKHNGVFQAQYLLRSFFFHISGFRQNCTAAKEAVLPLDAHLRDVPFPFRVLGASPV